MPWLLHLALKCITFTVGQLITFRVNLGYIYGWRVTFSVVITFSGDLERRGLVLC